MKEFGFKPSFVNITYSNKTEAKSDGYTRSSKVPTLQVSLRRHFKTINLG